MENNRFFMASLPPLYCLPLRSSVPLVHCLLISELVKKTPHNFRCEVSFGRWFGVNVGCYLLSNLFSYLFNNRENVAFFHY
jgi:hypothetical protein